MNHLVSVVVQAYNSSDTILDTLESIKQQTYTNIELIVSDDCSKDDTVSVSRKWIEENRKRFIDAKVVTTEKNTGISENNNRGIDNSKGKYIFFIAADDMITEKAIEKMVQFCELNQKKIPIWDILLMCDEECDLSSVENYCKKSCDFALMDRNKQYHKLLIQNCIAAPAASFYPRELLQRTHGFNARYRWMEDYPMNVAVLRNGYSFGFLNEKLVLYRISAKSVMSSSKSYVIATEREFFFKERFWYLIQNGMLREAFGQFRYWINKK